MTPEVTQTQLLSPAFTAGMQAGAEVLKVTLRGQFSGPRPEEPAALSSVLIPHDPQKSRDLTRGSGEAGDDFMANF